MTGPSIAIVGAGPAGLAAALFLSRAGFRPVLVERFDEPKAVGSGLMLQPTGLSVLAALGLEGEIRAHGRPITRMFGKSIDTERVVLDIRYAALGEGVTGLAIHRSALFGVLYEAVWRQRMELETGFEVVALDRCADGRRRILDVRGRALGPFDLVIDSSGARSVLTGECGPVRRRELEFGALWASLPWPSGSNFSLDSLEQRYRRASVMVGVLPVGRRWAEGGETATFFWSLKPKDYGRWRERGLTAWADEVLGVWPAVEPLVAAISSPDDLVLARYGEHTLKSPIAERLAVIGDAAHSTSPQLGQGANMALLDAAALTSALISSPDIAIALSAYARARRRHVRLYQALSAAFTPFYQSDSRVLPAFRDHLLEPISRLPYVPRLLASLVCGLLVEPLGGLPMPAGEPVPIVDGSKLSRAS